jgi:hypothetical protein
MGPFSCAINALATSIVPEKSGPFIYKRLFMKEIWPSERAFCGPSLIGLALDKRSL